MNNNFNNNKDLLLDETSSNIETELINKSIRELRPKSWALKNQSVFLEYTLIIIGHLISGGLVLLGLWAYLKPLPLFASIPLVIISAAIFELLGGSILKKIYSSIFSFSQTKWLNVSIMIIIGLIVYGTNLIVSNQGGIDRLETYTDKPEYIAPTLLTRADIIAEYNPQIASADADAKAFKKANQYKGRLDIKRGQQYKQLLDEKNRLSKEKSQALDNLNATNDKTIESSKTAFADELSLWQNKNNNRTIALYLGSLFAIIMYIVGYGIKAYKPYRILLDALSPEQLRAFLGKPGHPTPPTPKGGIKFSSPSSTVSNGPITNTPTFSLGEYPLNTVNHEVTLDNQDNHEKFSIKDENLFWKSKGRYFSEAQLRADLNKYQKRLSNGTGRESTNTRNIGEYNEALEFLNQYKQLA